jgi:asparagine synthetase B (glutamine-hydrolysing)
VSERKYWDHLPAADEPWLCDETVHEQFEETLTRAIGRCLALAPSGMMLSGGVDAVTIAALASKRLSEERLGPLTAVCATGRPLSHEEAMQSRLSAALGMPMVPSSTAEWTEGRNDVELSMEMTSELPCPTSVWWVGSYTRFYRRTAAQGFNVLLTGAGGDNWLGAADAHAADLMGRLQLIQLYRFLKADIGTSGSSLPRSLHRLLWKSGVQMHIDSLWALLAPKLKSQHHRQRWIENLPSWLCPDRELRQQLIEHLLNRRMPALTPAGTIPKSYYRHSLRPAASPSWHHENETAYHLETWCGLRLLSPYYDRRLVSFFNRISPGVLLDGDRYKGLLRPVVARHLPGFGLGTQRKAYVKEVQELDLQNLYHGVMREWERQDFKSLNRLGVIDGPATQREIRRIDGKRIDPMVRLFALMNAECWTHLHTAA